jgi:hypothetical protein
MIPNEIKMECAIDNDDLIAWNTYHLQKSNTWNRIQKNKFYAYSSAVFCLFFGFFALLKGIMTEFSPWGWAGVAAVLLGLIPLSNNLFAEHYMLSSIKKRVNELYGHGKDVVIGIHKYTISLQGVHDVISPRRWRIYRLRR